MKEEKEFRVTAEDGKVLMQVYSELPSPMPTRLEEVCGNAVAFFGKKSADLFGTRILQVYDLNTDPRKRIHIKPLTACCKGEFTMQGERARVVLHFSVGMDRKRIFSFEEEIYFDCTSGRVMEKNQKKSFQQQAVK